MKQTEYDCLYAKYLMILNMRYNLEESCKAEEDIAAVSKYKSFD
jgi:hypothetical protein